MVGIGNPKNLLFIFVNLSIKFFKQFNVLNPTSSDGSPVCLINLLDSVIVGYRNSWYEYTGIEPATDGSWKRLAIPYGCASEYSVQVVNLYSFI